MQTLHKFWAVTYICLDLATSLAYRSLVGWLVRDGMVWEKGGGREGKEGNVGREKRQGEIGRAKKTSKGGCRQTTNGSSAVACTHIMTCLCLFALPPLADF